MSTNHSSSPLSISSTSESSASPASLSLSTRKRPAEKKKNDKKEIKKKKKRSKSHIRDGRLKRGGGGGRDHRRESIKTNSKHTASASSAPSATSTTTANTTSSTIDMSTSDDDDDSSINNINPAVTNKASAEVNRNEYHIDQRAIVHRVKKYLTARHVKKDESDTNSLDDMKNILGALVGQRDHLLQHAITVDREDKLDNRMFNHISELLPCDGGVKRSITKPEIVDILVGVWRVLVLILKHPSVKLGILPRDRLDSYIWLMEDSWDLCESWIMTEKTVDKNSKAMKMPEGEMSRPYDGNYKPPAPFFICPQCCEPFMHEAIGNEAAREDNRANRKEHQRLLKAAAKEGDGNPVEKQKDKPEVLICKACQMRHSFGKKGYKCSECTDRSCKRCSNNCRFVCTEM